MSDVMMQFPDTLDEFIEQYKFVDDEQIYTDGSELIPVFRIKQWEEHKQKKGKWIHREDYDCLDKRKVVHWHGMCSQCEVILDFVDCHTGHKYCPHCGAEMEREESGADMRDEQDWSLSQPERFNPCAICQEFDCTGCKFRRT